MDRSALARATDPSSAPTPGYLYNDIGKSLTSPQVCIDTLAYLLSRLSKANPHIKRKSLKVLSKICAHPASRGMMKRTVVQNPAAISCIKEAISYRGTMDAVTGDQYNIEVREAAKECLDAVYSDAGETSMTTAVGMGATASMTGGGLGMGMGMGGNSNPYGASPAGNHDSNSQASSRSSTMQGIGNPMFADPRLSQRNAPSGTLGAFTELASNVGGAMLEMIKDPLARNVDPSTIGRGGGVGGVGGYNPNARPDPYAQNPPGRNNITMQTGGQWTMASNRGPNAIGVGGAAAAPTSSNGTHLDSEYYKARNAQGGGQAFSWAATGGGGGGGASPGGAVASPPPSAATSGVGGSWATAPTPAPTSATNVAAMARQPPATTANGVASAVPVYERNMILELCPPGGMKAEPPRDKLDDFARAMPSLNPDVVCPALLDALEEGNPWIMRAKALCVIETALRVEAERTMTAGGGMTPYTDFFHACSAEIEPLANHARVSVKAPARRVLMALGVDGATNAGASADATVVAQAPVAPPPNLLDFDEPSVLDGATAFPPPSSPPPPPPPAAPPVPPQASEGGTGGSLFSGLNTKATSAPAASASIAPSPTLADFPSTSSSSQPQDDLLCVTGAEASVPTAGGFNDLFGNMSVKSTEASVDSATSNAPNSAPANVAPATLSGSGFGFMNATTASPGLPSPTKQFDPLLGLGMPVPNSNISNFTPNNTFMAPSPNIAQMQLAYQQNMIMMQQMQMQQQVNNGLLRGAPLAMPNMSPQTSGKPIMGANYMRQVPGVSGEKLSSFSFLAQEPKKKEIKSFDFVMDAMKSEKK
ncbi:hypothetical protein ACHAXA_000103 [Cyclostephanos tholiformis]|uniref:ENTH domain-containing protein n=1 Tax=Cyclostephanos tholiformis TaxID=382380 RepID=A0ABD3RXX0_9STRA